MLESEGGREEKKYNIFVWTFSNQKLCAAIIFVDKNKVNLIYHKKFMSYSIFTDKLKQFKYPTTGHLNLLMPAPPH